jgi:2'-phosphotransferase
MRKSSQILIHINVQKAIDHGLTFYLSTNGVILSEGDENGFIAPTYFKRVENSNRIALPGWEGPAAEFHNVLAEGLPPAVVEETERGSGVDGVEASGTARLSKDGPSELVDKLQNVKLT